MKNLCKIIFLSILFSINAEAQTVTWQKWYDYNNMDSEGSDAIQTIDGGYLILSNNFAVMNFSTLLIKLNINGKIEWQKLIDRSVSGGDGLSCFAVQQSKDSGFVVSGYMLDSALLIKINMQGELMWIKKYARQGNQSKFYGHIICKDGGIIACGNIYPPTPFNTYIVKTDSIGNIEWDSEYSSGTTLKIIQSKDSNFFYFTSTNKISKINNSGYIVWVKNFSGIGSDLFEYSAEELYLSGGSNGQMLLVKIDSSGNYVWQKNYFGGGCQSMCLSKDNNILLTGFKDTLSQYNIMVVKTDLKGNQIFGKRINSFIGNYSVIPNSVKPATDSGFIFTGFTDFPRNFTHDNTYAAKTDSVCFAPKLVGIEPINIYNLLYFKLNQNYPNPFNGSTVVTYELSVSAFVDLRIYDLKGREIKILVFEFKNSGYYKLYLNFIESNLSSGIYFLKLKINSDIITKKVTFLK